jgi:protocatechuate 3,4-dioxygenase beta subunit
MTTDRHRRDLVLGVVGLLLAAPAWARRVLETTPAQTAGPFYPETPPLDDDNDLTRVRGRSRNARGRISDVSGRILDVNGRALAGTRVEIWQCDANGRYHHARDQGGELDPNFQGFGHTQTDTEGRYRFRTIRPVPYPGRTPHIHFAAVAPGAPVFTTQLYVKGEPRNAGDFVFTHIPAERRHLVLAEFAPVSGTGRVSARFDIVLGGVDGTPGA